MPEKTLTEIVTLIGIGGLSALLGAFLVVLRVGYNGGRALQSIESELKSIKSDVGKIDKLSERIAKIEGKLEK